MIVRVKVEELFTDCGFSSSDGKVYLREDAPTIVFTLFPETNSWGGLLREDKIPVFLPIETSYSGIIGTPLEDAVTDILSKFNPDARFLASMYMVYDK